MDTLSLSSSDIDLQRASNLISDGQIIAFPTETVFGFGISLDCSSYHKLYELKGRPKQKALTLHLSDIDLVFQFVENVDDRFFSLANSFLPGPLTLIMKANISMTLPFITDGTIGIRIPSNPIAKKFIEFCGKAILATSANLSGESPCISSNEVKTIFNGKVSAIIKEEMQNDCGIPSTVISLVDELKILREGTVSIKEILKVLKNQKMRV